MFAKLRRLIASRTLGGDVENLIFEPSSFFDPVGRVFYFNGGVYRGIVQSHAQYARDTLEAAEKHEWFDFGLVKTSVSPMSVSGFPLVLQHQKFEFTTTRAEWAGEGLRAATLCTLRLLQKLIESRWALKDGHPWNIMFDGTCPIFVDFGSIVPIEKFDQIKFYDELRCYFLAPLHLFSIEEPRLAREALREQHTGVGLQLTKMGDTRFFSNDLDAHGFNLDVPLNDILDYIIRRIVEMKLPKIEGKWSVYPQQDIELDQGQLLPKHQIVQNLLAQDEGRTLFDIGASRGLHSMMAEKLGKNVLSGDVEESILNDVFLKCASRNSRAIQPIYYNFLHPMPASGILGAIASATDRLRCDTVLMLALTHHLVFGYGLNFKAIARGIWQLVKKKAIVEFVSPKDIHVQEWNPDRLPWYRLELFLDDLSEYFKRVEVVPLDEASIRVLILCEDPRRV